MAKAELLFLLILFSCSYGLIDPPIEEVYQHNMENAPPNEVLHSNILGIPERGTSVTQPVHFFYVRILTLNPSVNYSINSKMHPELIWLVAEGHDRTFYESGGDEDSCTAWRHERTYDDLEIGSVTAEYSVDGLIKKEGNQTIFNIANETQLLADNETFSSIVRVPFERPWTASLLDLFTHHILGDMIDLTTYEESLAYASPYPRGSIDPHNVSKDAIKVVNPHLNVTIHARFNIPYTGTYREQEEDEDGDCSWGEPRDLEGSIPLYDWDFATYEVQNDYMTLIPYSPHFFSFEANVTEDVPLVTSLFSNSKLYKYYSTMDGDTAAFHYINSFEVVNDSYGIETIIAVPADKEALLTEDPRVANNFTGQHAIVLTREGEVLRNAGQLNSLDYNYSRVYYINEFFYNLSEGKHDVGMEYYTWFGQYNASYNLTVKSDTSLIVEAHTEDGGRMVATCLLTARGIPVAGQTVELKVGNETRYASTNSLGICQAEFGPPTSKGIVTADFHGTSAFIPSDAMDNYYVPKPGESPWDVLDENLGLLILLSMMFAVAAFSAMNAAMTSLLAGGAAFGSMFNKLFPFAKGLPKGKKMIRVKKGKELVVSVAMAVATGGASAGAAGKAIMDKLGSKAAEKGVKDKIAKEAEKKAKKDASKKGLDKKTKAKIEEESKKKGIAGAVKDKEKKPKKPKRKNSEALSGKEIKKKYQDFRTRLAEDKMREDKTYAQRRLVIESQELGSAYVDGGGKIVNAIEKVEGRSDVRFVLKSDMQGNRVIILDNRRLTHSFNVVDGSLWYEYCEVSGKKAIDTLGVTIGRREIYMPIWAADNAVYFNEAIWHEPWHVLSKVDNPILREGIADLESYRSIQANEKIDKAVKEQVRMTYRNEAAINYLVEQVVGEDFYMYCHGKAGEDVLIAKFDNVAKGLEYERIFEKVPMMDGDGNVRIVDKMSDTDKIDNLKRICRRLPEVDYDLIKGNVENILNEGKINYKGDQ